MNITAHSFVLLHLITSLQAFRNFIKTFSAVFRISLKVSQQVAPFFADGIYQLHKLR